MKAIQDKIKSAFLLSALFLLSFQIVAQDNFLELLPGSDRFEHDKISGIGRLYGNVSFKYQGNIMYCDSAYYFKNKNEVRAYGNVHVNKGNTLNLFCDSLYYSGKSKNAKLWGNVRVRDKEFKLTTDTLDYDANKGQAFYHYGGRVESIVSHEVLTSKVGYFYPNSKNFYFSNDVVYKSADIEMTTDTLQYIYSEKRVNFHGETNIIAKETKMYCESGWYNTETEEGELRENAWIQKENDFISGDTLIYLPKEQLSIGKGNVLYMDTAQKVEMTGEYAYMNDSTHISYLTDSAFATKYMDDDTLYLHADTLFIEKIDSSDIIKAYHHAAMYSRKVQSRADSIVFNSSQNYLLLNNHPIVWSNMAELKGDTIRIYMSDSTIDYVDIINHASIVMEVEKDNYYNQIAGRKIVANFKNNEIYRANVTGNALTIFYPEEELKTDSTLTISRKGMNRLYSSTLRIDIDSSEITGVTYIEKPDGAFYPMNNIKVDEKFVQGFVSKLYLRPSEKDDLLILPEELDKAEEDRLQEKIKKEEEDRILNEE